MYNKEKVELLKHNKCITNIGIKIIELFEFLFLK